MTQIHGTVTTERKKDRQRFTFEFCRADDGKRLLCVGAVGFQKEFANPLLGDKILVSGEIYGDEVYASTVEILPWNTAFETFPDVVSKEANQETACSAQEIAGFAGGSVVLPRNISEGTEQAQHHARVAGA